MDRSKLTMPVYEYPHGKPKNHCSVTGGFVYRGAAIPSLRGAYFWADVCSGAVGTLRLDDAGKVTEALDRTAELDPDGRLISIISFGQDASRELYLLSQRGTIWKIVPGAPAAD